MFLPVRSRDIRCPALSGQWSQSCVCSFRCSCTNMQWSINNRNKFDPFLSKWLFFYNCPWNLMHKIGCNCNYQVRTTVSALMKYTLPSVAGWFLILCISMRVLLNMSCMFKSLTKAIAFSILAAVVQNFYM